MSTRNALRFIAAQILDSVPAAEVDRLCDRLAAVDADTQYSDEQSIVAQWLMDELQQPVERDTAQ